MSVRQGNNTIAGSGYTKSEVDTLLAGKADTALSNITATGKEVCANMSMPSNKYINLTLGASGASYTAPADGYVFFCKVAQEFPREILLANDAGMTSQMISVANGNWLRVWLPVRKGSVFKVTYDVTGETKFFIFVYANGAV